MLIQLGLPGPTGPADNWQPKFRSGEKTRPAKVQQWHAILPTLSGRYVPDAAEQLRLRRPEADRDSEWKLVVWLTR